MTSRQHLRVKNIPEILTDSGTKKRYRKGLFLGKGGFARCYELIDLETNVVYAGKIVAKSQLTKPHQKEKMVQEIAIHRSLQHHHIVTFHGYFEDTDFVYIILELCRRRSLMEMLKRRRALTEPEARYFLRQVALACKYLHNDKIIHRDLKLGNLFLSDTIEIKLGDFGLATKLEFDGERKQTLCGTPNYIAPEVLGKKGHSFEVDSWSLGCILFTLLVGRPPFETATLKDTYTRIKKNDYHVPSYISTSAASLIRRLLHSNPNSRLTMEQILDSDFMKDGYLPPELPVSCLTVPPRFNTTSHLSFSTFGNVSARKPLAVVNKETTDAITVLTKPTVQTALATVPEGEVLQNAKPEESHIDTPKDIYLGNLHKMLLSVIASKPTEKTAIQPEEAEDPAAVPVFWVSKWVDYTEKYGLGYQLCDNSIGVMFNDATHILLLADGQNVQYIDREEAEEFYTLQEHPERLNKKFTLLKHFQSYMNEHLLKTGENVTRESDKLSRLPYLNAWFRTKSAIVLHLTSGTLQINFFKDHTKIILCPLMGAVTYINEKRQFTTYRMKLIEKYGCGNELLSRLCYAKTVVEKLLISRPGPNNNK